LGGVPQETLLGPTRSTSPATIWHSGILAQLATSLGQQMREGMPRVGVGGAQTRGNGGTGGGTVRSGSVRGLNPRFVGSALLLFPPSQRPPARSTLLKNHCRLCCLSILGVWSGVDVARGSCRRPKSSTAVSPLWVGTVRSGSVRGLATMASSACPPPQHPPVWCPAAYTDVLTILRLFQSCTWQQGSQRPSTPAPFLISAAFCCCACCFCAPAARLSSTSFCSSASKSCRGETIQQY